MVKVVSANAIEMEKVKNSYLRARKRIFIKLQQKRFLLSLCLILLHSPALGGQIKESRHEHSLATFCNKKEEVKLQLFISLSLSAVLCGKHRERE
jgi:hypothetical protein